MVSFLLCTDWFRCTAQLLYTIVYISIPVNVSVLLSSTAYQAGLLLDYQRNGTFTFKARQRTRLMKVSSDAFFLFKGKSRVVVMVDYSGEIHCCEWCVILF